MKKTDYLVILAPMVNELGLQGNSLLVFAMIHGFSKDGSHKFVGSFQYIADWLNVSIRSVKDIVAGLIKDGYIRKEQVKNDRNRPINVYASNYEELLERVAAGEEVKPSSIKSRSRSKKVNGAENAPLITTIANGAENALLMVQKVPFNGAKNAPNNDIYNNIDIESYYSSIAREDRPYSEEENKFFYLIFFKRNAADPAAEVTRFVGWYDTRDWTAKDGTKYNTPGKRARLAGAWNIQGTPRLPVSSTQDEQLTKKYYAFLDGIFKLAQERAPFDPWDVLDPRCGYRVTNDGKFVLIWMKHVWLWFKGLDLDITEPIKVATLGDIPLYYQM